MACISCTAASKCKLPMISQKRSSRGPALLAALQPRIQNPHTSATGRGPARLAAVHHQVGLHHDEAGVALRPRRATYNPGSKTPHTSATGRGPARLAAVHHQVGLHHDEAGVALRPRRARLVQAVVLHLVQRAARRMQVRADVCQPRAHLQATAGLTVCA